MVSNLLSEKRLIALIVIVFLGMVGRQHAGEIEGRFFPVVSPVTITSMADSRDASEVVISGRVSKLRSCRFVGMQWHLGTRNRSVIVRRDTTTTIRHRAVGETFDVGPWRLHMSRGQLQTSSYAIVLHRCHPLWLTASVLHET